MSLSARLFSRRTAAVPSKEAYFTASQGQLIWQRFKANRTARFALYVLLFFILCGIFAPFLSPYNPTAEGRNADYTNGAPQIPQFCDDNGCSWRPFIHGVERYRGVDTNFRWVTRQTDERNYVTLLPEGSDYRLLGLIPMNRHLFGVEEGFVHLFGTDAQGKDIFSRTLHAIGVSLAVGSAGVLISAAVSGSMMPLRSRSAVVSGVPLYTLPSANTGFAPTSKKRSWGRSCRASSGMDERKKASKSFLG